MDKELEEIYKWLRSVAHADKIPTSWQWYNVCLIKDMDKRLTELEKKEE